MKYSVNLRMKNQGPAKYLIDSHDTDSMCDAFTMATAVLASVDESEHFVEIIDNDSHEKIAGFNERN